MRKLLAALTICGVGVIFAGECNGSASQKRLPIPDKLVVLTFDDGNKPDIAYVAPLLKRYGFGATFFITEGLGFLKDKKTFLTWDEIRKLHEAGFEIGNHTRSHPNVTRLSKEQLLAQVEHIEKRCKEHGIPAPKTFCYPGWGHSRKVVEVLLKKGYLFARRGSGPEFPEEGSRGIAYDPTEDHPLLVPTTGTSGPNWEWEDFVRAVEQAKDGKICVLTFHGVPTRLHPWVNTKPDDFGRYMKYLHDQGYTVIALRDLARYVDPAKRPSNPYAAIERRLEVTPVELKCEYSVNPLGIDTPQPRFSWILESMRRGQKQSAYQVLVAGSESKLKSDAGDKWDSGKVASGKSVHVAYHGKALSSGEKCWWKVRCWDKDGKVSPWSKPGTFEMGLLKKNDWQGKWIGMGRPDTALGYIAGRFGKAVDLNGKTECIRIKHYAKLKPKAQITISAWVKPGDDLGNQPPGQGDNWREIYRKDDGNARQLLALGKSGKIEGVWFGLGIAGSYTEHGASAALKSLKDGKWHFIAATYDGSSMRFYADGKEIGAASVSGRIDTAGTSPAYIGSSEGRNEFFPGGIDDVRVYSRALSAKEIQAMAAKSTGSGPGLVGWWKLDGDLKNGVAGSGGKAAGAGGALVSAPLLRKEFEITKKVRRARVYLSGLGWNELYINGRKVGDHVLDPATSYYNNDQPVKLGSRVLYVTFDVTEHLKSGRNAVGVMLGNGWYGHDGQSPGRQPFADSPQLILQMNVDFTDGTSMSVVSDDKWKASGGPITANEICIGEHYDARLEKTGWRSPGYDDSSWPKTVPVEAPSGVLVAQTVPPVKVMQTIKPVKITKHGDGVYVYDFGQHFSGWTRLRVSGAKGTRVTLRHAGAVADKGRLDTKSQRGAAQTDVYILKGEGVEVWEPRFTLHGFRYVEMTGFPATPTRTSLEGRFVYNAVETSGSFECSNPLLNRIHRNVCWTFMTSLQGIPQDAGDRSERVGWLGDTGFVCEDYIYNLDTAAFWAKWLNDIKDSQRPNGDVPVVSPLHWRTPYTWYPCWKSTYPVIAWYLYEYYGDKRVLVEHYDGMKKLVDFLATKAREDIIPNGLGDHMEPDKARGRSSFSPRRTPGTLTSTAYYYYDSWIVARAAEIIGKADEAKRYSDLAGRIKKAFIEKFFDEKTNQFATGSQTSNAVALYLGLVPEGREQAVLKNLVDDIMIKNDGHLSTGILGTNALEQVLGEHGRADVMYKIATRTTYPSWGYTISKGATTVWESFEDNNHSLNMKMFGSTEKFFYKDLAGIGLAAPGFKQIAIKPRAVGDLTYARASLKTVRGLVAVDWKKGSKSFSMRVTIPANTTARVSVPKLGLKKIAVTESRKPVWKAGKFVAGAPGIAAGSEAQNYITFDVGSGFYVFQLTGQ